MPLLLTDDKEEIKQIVKEILDIARKDLVYTKIKAPTNKERDKKKYYHKKMQIKHPKQLLKKCKTLT